MHDIEEGSKASATICDYVDSLLSTNNPQPPEDESSTKPVIHPCRKKFEDIPNSQLENDYIDLLNIVQRHTHCSTSYCLKRKQENSELQCRFKFPFDLCYQTRLEFEPVNSKDNTSRYRAKIVTKQNDPIVISRL